MLGRCACLDDAYDRDDDDNGAEGEDACKSDLLSSSDAETGEEKEEWQHNQDVSAHIEPCRDVQTVVASSNISR